MSTDRSRVSQETIEQTKQQIRGLVGEINQLAKSDLGAEEFYAAFLQRVVSALAAVGGAVWTINEGGRPKLMYQINLSETLLDPQSEDTARHLKMLQAIIARGEPQLVPPLASGEDPDAGANPTRFLLVLAPLKSEGVIEGVVEIFQRPDSQPVTQRGYLRFLLQMCELAGEWLKSRKLKQFSDRHSLWAQADHFSRLVHEGLDARETAYTIANEGRRLIGCDRVAVAFKKGNKCIIEAISGQDTIDNRSNIVAALNKLSTRVVATGEPLWYEGVLDDLPPQVEEAVESYVEESYAKSVTVLPLRKPRPLDAEPRSAAAAENEVENTEPLEVIGALIIEQIESDLPREVIAPRVDLVYEHSARALSNALDHSNLFLMPVWRAIGRAAWIVRARTLPKTITIASIVAVIVLCMFIPWSYNMRAKGSLQPEIQRDVYVREGGIINKWLVDHGDMVTAGQVIGQIDNHDLEAAVQKAEGELATTERQRRNIDEGLKGSPPFSERIKLIGDSVVLKQRTASLILLLETLKQKQADLTVRAPISGQIITWDAKKLLERRPVTPGQVLVTVADPNGPWQLELYMPERRAGKVDAAQEALQLKELPVTYILATHPDKSLSGTVKNVDRALIMHEEEGHVMRVRVNINKEDVLDPKTGAGVTGKVYCGTRPLGWCWFHEAVEWVQAWWF